MKRPFSPPGIQWLVDPVVRVPVGDLETADVIGMPLNIPPELGSGSLDLLHLPFGGSLVRGTHRFLPAARGRLVSLGEVWNDLKGPAFGVQTMRGGRCCHQEFDPESTLLYEDGRDLFCHTSERHLIPMVDGASSSTMISLCLPMPSFEALLGREEASAVMKALGIAVLPTVVVREMPKPLGALLQASMTGVLEGPAKRLFAQAKALEYVSALSEHLKQGVLHPSGRAQSRERSRALHDHLLAMEGKLPTMEVLAKQFNCPARRLNVEFAQEFGESIFAFIVGRRLEEAREALLHTDTPIKVLSARLGYTHVSHFSNAFKRRFKLSPGRLRRAEL